MSTEQNKSFMNISFRMSCTHRSELIDDDDRSDSSSVYFLSNIKCFHCHVLKCLDDSLEHFWIFTYCFTLLVCVFTFQAVTIVVFKGFT